MPPASLPIRKKGHIFALPASPGLPPARKLRKPSTRDKRVRRHPTLVARSTAQRVDAVIAAAAEVLTAGTPIEKAAIAAGASADGRSVKALVRTARELFARRAEFYVEAHAAATTIAAQDGNAGPAQWALEHIAEDGERVVDLPKTGGTAAPVQVYFGNIALGGLPGRRVDEPVIEAVSAMAVSAGEAEGRGAGPSPAAPGVQPLPEELMP
jgi:hypothetical protein